MGDENIISKKKFKNSNNNNNKDIGKFYDAEENPYNNGRIIFWGLMDPQINKRSI